MSLEFLNAFKFMRKESFLHNLDPRAKLFLAIVYTIVALLFNQIIPLFLILLSLVPLVVIGKIFRQWIKSIRGLSFLVIFIIILNTLFISLSFAIAMILRIFIMISAFSIFFLTVDPNNLALSLISMKIPYEFAFSFSLAFRFVPTIAKEAQNIMDAQQSRGYEMQEKGLINQIKNLFPLLIPLIICSIRRAFNVAEALESRAFGSKKERSYYYIIKYSFKDWIFTLYLVLFLILFIVLRIQFNLMPEFFSWSLPV
ncbi:MAG: energy-coupling factor transporter transmembrane protein EcfT [Candidatus Lokiarchaeota archaeon]|nr:energy-coupling factor transporter transmembrane protein EcfT [Candidatus Lokiarchaeota archaeon]